MENPSLHWSMTYIMKIHEQRDYYKWRSEQLEEALESIWSYAASEKFKFNVYINRQDILNRIDEAREDLHKATYDKYGEML